MRSTFSSSSSEGLRRKEVGGKSGESRLRPVTRCRAIGARYAKAPHSDRLPRFLKEAEQFFRTLTGAVLHGNLLERNALSYRLQLAINMGADEETAALAADHAIWSMDALMKGQFGRRS